tara:strand:+ start:8613 stop:10196 length:1584 start_codon:yes stop_codon:yes gene_type:complete
MKDVKSYLNLVGTRLGKAFSLREFDTEDELEFWSLSAEHMSRSKPPSFQDIVQWIDILYRAPVHIVYKKEGDELFLFKRSINVENLIGKDKSESLTTNEKTLISDFEQQVQNLQQKRKWYPDSTEAGVSSTAVGNCEHIPLFDENREIWGLYMVGPNSKCPEVIVPRLSIVGRLLSIWLSKIDTEEKGQKNNYLNKMEHIVSDLGSGALNTDALSRFYLRFLLNGFNNKKGAVIEDIAASPSIICNEDLSQNEVIELIKNAPDFNKSLEPITLVIKGFGEVTWIPFSIANSVCSIVMVNEKVDHKYDMYGIQKVVSIQFSKLLLFRDDNSIFTESLVNSYYEMLRVIEKSRQKTQFHTPRLLAFVERFAMVFGLDEQESEILKKTAKLHDIGYVGGLSIESNISIGSELSHPLTGYKLIDQLPIHEDIKYGVLTHHEWVNGEGTPNGLGVQEISWTGKVISIFEYIVEFIENNISNETKTPEEWIESLSQSIIERADVQFDMVLVPTVIELVKMLGWEKCCTLGTNE